VIKKYKYNLNTFFLITSMNDRFNPYSLAFETKIPLAILFFFKQIHCTMFHIQLTVYEFFIKPESFNLKIEKVDSIKIQ